MAGATDRTLRELARQLAGRIVLDLARTGAPRARGVGKLRPRPAALADGDVDVDASLDALVQAMASNSTPDLDDVVVSEWAKPDTALSLVIDKSGSMGGERLAAAGLAAAAVAWRAPDDHSVLAFADRAIIIKSQDVMRDAAAVVDDVFSLRGHGRTDLDLALRQAKAQLDRSRAKRRIVVLLSDCEPTSGADPLAAARRLDELLIMAPTAAAEIAAAFAGAAGARLALLDGPATIPAAFARLLQH